MICPNFSPSQIHIRKEAIYFKDRYPRTIIKETRDCLKLQTQDLICAVELEINNSYADNNWTIGLIQGCDQFYQIQQYGDSGLTAWDFHPLRTGRAKVISDSDTTPSPFYSNTAKIEIAPGIVQQRNCKIYIKDLFMPFISWSVLDKNPDAYLTHITRRQSFFVWLVALKRGIYGYGDTKQIYSSATTENDDLYVMKTFRWTYDTHLQIEYNNPLGERVVAIRDKQQSPVILDRNVRIPSAIFNGLTCNEIQSLIWHPNEISAPKVVMVEPLKYWMDQEIFYREMFSWTPKTSSQLIRQLC